MSDPFETPKSLVDYLETHATTQMALVHRQHVIQLGYIAGADLSGYTKEQYMYGKPGTGLVSLHDYNMDWLITNARRRIDAGDVPETWKADLERQLGVTAPAT